MYDICGQREGWTVNSYANHTGWLTIVAKTNYPRSVCDRSVMEGWNWSCRISDLYVL